jgi:hypothetical protein
VLPSSILIEGVSVEKLGVDSLRITGCVTHIRVLFIIADAVLGGIACEIGNRHRRQKSGIIADLYETSSAVK